MKQSVFFFSFQEERNSSAMLFQCNKMAKFRRVNKCLVMLKYPLNPQLAVIVNKITVYVSTANGISILPLKTIEHSTLYHDYSNSAAPIDIQRIQWRHILFTLIDKCGELLWRLQWAINKRFLIRTEKKKQQIALWTHSEWFLIRKIGYCCVFD